MINLLQSEFWRSRIRGLQTAFRAMPIRRWMDSRWNPYHHSSALFAIWRRFKAIPTALPKNPTVLYKGRKRRLFSLICIYRLNQFRVLCNEARIKLRKLLFPIKVRLKFGIKLVPYKVKFIAKYG